jgi:prepilin peptidase CpaA
MLTTLWNHGWPQLQWGVVLAVCLVSAIWDLGNRRIPNFLTGPVFITGLVWSLSRAGGMGLVDSVLGCVILALPYVLLFVFAGGGAGDAKLMGAIGIWLGVVNGLAVLACVALSGVIMGVIWALARRQLRELGANLTDIVLHALRWLAGDRKLPAVLVQEQNPPQTSPRRTMPYGVAILAGVCIAAMGISLWRP